jgi:membrane-associated protease RseP (regulator of RpoE activity)
MLVSLIKLFHPTGKPERTARLSLPNFISSMRIFILSMLLALTAGTYAQSSTKDPFLGVSPVHQALPDGVNGVPISIVQNSTAQAMGLERGDIITAIDGKAVESFHDMAPIIDDRQVGDEIEVSVYRSGNAFTRIRPIKSLAATHGDHSRGNGPDIIRPEAADTAGLPPIAQVSLEPVSSGEVKQLPVYTAPAAEVSAESTAAAPLFRELEVSKLNIFPNPNTGIFDIRLELPGRDETAVYIYNPAGQPVYFNTLGNFSGTFSDRIDIANGVRGVYFLEVRQGQRSLTRKIVLQ